eukprot:6173326-Pleurochrysis_carterae.AAC.3
MFAFVAGVRKHSPRSTCSPSTAQQPTPRREEARRARRGEGKLPGVRASVVGGQRGADGHRLLARVPPCCDARCRCRARCDRAAERATRSWQRKRKVPVQYSRPQQEH